MVGVCGRAKTLTSWPGGKNTIKRIKGQASIIPFEGTPAIA
jgi:hypothetical protein